MKYSQSYLLTSIFWLITRIVGCLLLGSLGCILASLLIVISHGQYNGLNFLQSLLMDQLHYLSQVAKISSINTINQWISMVPNQWQWTPISLPLLSEHVEKIILIKCSPYIEAGLLGIKLLSIRLYCLLHWSTLFFLLGLVGLIDGLSQRAIRRASAGRESAFIYHQAKALVHFSLIIGIFISLSLPITTRYITLLVIIASLLFSLAMKITAKHFKKYL